MMTFLRSQSQTVLTIVLAVIGLGFLFYGNAGNLLTGSGHVNSDFGRIEGEDLTQADLYNAVRNTRDSLIVSGRSEALGKPGASAQLAQEAWRQLLLLHEADRLHIDVSDEELANFIKSLPLFQKDGVYDPSLYQSRMAILQNAYHISPDALATIMRDSIRTEAVKSALFSNARASAREVGKQFEKFYGPVQVSVITFDAKPYIAAAQVTPQEIEAEYKDHPQNPAYRSKEERKVDYVLFPLPPDKAKLTGQDKAAAIDALGQKALEFALAFQPEPSATPGATPAPTPDFLAEAQKRGLTPATTDFFAADSTPTNLPPSPAFNNAAFELTKDNPVSKVVEMDNGVAVLHLAEIKASDLLPLDLVKADITKALQQSKGRKAAEDAAKLSILKLKLASAMGQDFKTAAANDKLAVESIPAFVPIKAPETDQRLRTIAYTAAGLDAGQFSEPVPLGGDQSIIIHLDRRDKADPANLAEFESRFLQSRNEQLRYLVYVDWALWKSKQPGTHLPPDLDAYGAVE